MKRFVAAVAAVGALAGVASAGDYVEPKKAIRAADHARARSIVLKRSDLPGQGWKASKPDPQEPSFSCPGVDADFSNLTLSGEAESLDFVRGTTGVSSGADVYATAEQARESFDRSTPPLLRCVALSAAREISAAGVSARVLSARVIPFRRLPVRTRALQVVMEVRGPAARVELTMDVIVLQHARVSAGLVVADIGRKPPAALELALARAVASRMRA